MSFFDSLRLAIVFGLSLFLVLLRFDSDRIIRSDYFRYRSSWLGAFSYYTFVIVFALLIAFVFQDRDQLFLRGGDTGVILQSSLLFTVIGLANAAVLAFLRFGAITPLPTRLLASRTFGSAANAVADELQFRSVVLGLLLFAGASTGLALVVQALLFGLAHRRLWRERDWYFLAASVLLGYGAGMATLAAGSVIPAIVGHFAVSMALFAFAGGRLRQRPI
ncbi:MAG: CPBP family glutamic-type intramembrane protease [Chloroflexota bacterium]|nr:CPBP family glutamic-type intramembrane protease [Chloroflexota bacterium]